jgi:predicted dehydrogenase
MNLPFAVFAIGLLSAAAANGQTRFTGAAGEIRLMILDPGHFHAALVQKSMADPVSPAVDVYAPEGPELQDYLLRIRGFNSRADHPTSWDVRLHTGPDFLDRMIREKPGNVVVIAGNNLRKTEFIRACVDAGLNVLSDKPMCIDRDGFAMLEKAFESAERNRVLIDDIMTERFEITNILQKELVHLPGVFGRILEGTPGHPAVIKESVHHFYKVVSGSPVTRPPWFFDTRQQGEGIVDVTTHLVDLVQWECFPGQVIRYPSDISMREARRWPSMISLEQFRKATKLAGFPDFLNSRLGPDGALPVFSNGEMVYRIKGHWAKVSVQWNFEAPAGGGDTHFSVIRGSRCDAVIRQGGEQNYRPELYAEPAAGEDTVRFGRDLSDAVGKWNARYPGLGLRHEGSAWHVLIPDSYRVGHEAHFGQVANAYRGYLKDGKLPSWEAPNMLAKYYTTTRALEMAEH